MPNKEPRHVVTEGALALSFDIAHWLLVSNIPGKYSSCVCVDQCCCFGISYMFVVKTDFMASS